MIGFIKQNLILMAIYKNNVDLVFEGLDTISEIYLNNIRLGGTDNMFVKYRYNVKNILKAKAK